MRALVIGGGGQAGSRTAGTIYRKAEFYNLIVGTSTGAGIMTVANNPNKLKQSYTSTENSHIWKLLGVNKKDAPRWVVMLARLIGGRPSWGDSGNLKHTIQKFYTVADHQNYIDQSVELVACVWDHTEQQVKYFSNLDHRYYPNFVKYVEASMSAPPAMLMVQDPMNGNWLEDGGVAEVVPLYHAVQLARRRGIREVDCFVHSTRKELWGTHQKTKPKNHVHRLMRALNARGRHIIKDDLKTGLAEAQKLGVNVYIYYLPESDIKPRFYFIPELQTEWFNRPAQIPEAHINHKQNVEV